MTTDVSVATDLGALLRESIETGLDVSARESGHMPVDIVPATPLVTSGTHAVGARIPTPGEFQVVPAPPPSSVRGFAVDIAPASVAPVSSVTTAPAALTKSKKSGVLGFVFGAVALASVLGGGAFYAHKHHAAVAPVAAAAQAPAPAQVDEVPAPVEKAAAPVVTRTEEPAAEAAATPVAEAPKEDNKAVVAVKPRVAPVRAAAAPVAPKPVVEKVVEAPKPKAEAKVVEAPKPAPKPEKVVEAPKPAPKPAAGGAVDALLQQQLSGSIP